MADTDRKPNPALQGFGARSRPPKRPNPTPADEASPTEELSPEQDREPHDPIETPQRKAVMLSQAVFKALQAARSETGDSYTYIVETAFSTVPNVNYRALRGERQRPHQGMPRRQQPHNKISPAGEKVEVSLYLDGPQQQWLAQTVETSGAPDRSALIDALLENYLTNEGYANGRTRR